MIRVLLDGGSEKDAAKEVGTTTTSLWRYCQKDQEFKVRMERAKEQAEARGELAAAATIASELVEPDACPPKPPPQPTKAATVAAEIMGVDPDLVADIDEILSDELIELAGSVDLRKPSALGFVHVCWRRFISNRPDAALHGRLMEKVITGPTLRAQARRDAAAARREMLAEQRAAAERVEGKAGPSGAGMLVLEAPPNNARPFMAAKPDPVDAEVVE